MIRKLALAFAGLAVAAPVHAAEAPKVRALKDIYAAGFRDCSEKMAEAVAFVHEDDEAYDYLGSWSTNNPNTEMASAVTSQTYTDGHGVATVTAVKVQGGGCNVSITQALTVPEETCESLKTDAFKDWKPYAEFNEADVLEDPTSAGSHVVLTPIGKTACLMVKHIIVHQ